MTTTRAVDMALTCPRSFVNACKEKVLMEVGGMVELLTGMRM